MESSSEADRLLAKSDESTTREQLILTGLRPKMKALDAGGGAGFVTRIMADIVGSSGEAHLADLSEDRLSAARAHTSDYKNCFFHQTDLGHLRLQNDQFDYAFCRFVFEYLKNQEQVLAEMIRVVKPGGKVVVGDLDYNMLNHYPADKARDEKLQELIHQLQTTGRWDPYAGRRLYTQFYRAGLRDIKVHLLPHHLIYGQITERDYNNMKAKLDQMKKLQQSGEIQLSYDMSEFASSFLSFFETQERFTYTTLILVEAQKAAL